MFVLMAVLLFQRIFTLQIVQGEDKQQEFELKIKKERSIASTRGNIYDVNGIALAYNELSSSVTIEDVYESSKKMPQLTVSSKKSFIFWMKTATASAAISIFISMTTVNLPTA